jgi:hypothetical protein
MKRAILPLVLIMAMALIVSTAMATNYSTTGPIGSGADWSTSGNWNGNSPKPGTGDAYATHAVTIGPSKAFSLDVSFTIGNVANQMGAGILDAGGNRLVSLSYANGTVLLNGNNVSKVTLSPSTTYHAKISSQDGSLCHIDICGVTRDITFSGAPTQILVELWNRAGTAPAITSVDFVSSDDPVSTPTPPTPVPSENPVVTPAPASVSYEDQQRIQDFYANVYPLIGSPYDTVTYNADGTYATTKGYPVSDKHDVSGTVTGAADGKPIAGASVVLGNVMQKTDSAGKYLFEDVSNGASDIAVSALGFASKTQSVNVNADLTLDFALDTASTDGSTIASAANETANVTMPTNATVEPTMVPTTVPSATQTKSPGFEGIVAAIALIGVAGALVYVNRKH